MNHLPSILFAAGTLAWTAVLSVLYLPLFLGPRRGVQVGARFWIRGLLWWLRTTVGLDFEIRGAEHIPKGGALLAAKHQSAWDTIIFHILLDDPVFILKRELLMVPFFGWYLWKAGNVAIDRTAGAKALRGMVRDAGRRIAEGAQVVVFPEGTRSAPGAAPCYQPGVAALYTNLDQPVVPVALNSGVFWGRRSLTKLPGTVVLQALPPIAPGLDRRAFSHELESRIEQATTALIAEGRRALKAPDAR